MFGNLSSFKTTVPGQISVPTSFVSLFLFYILSHRLSKTMGCLSGSLMSSASIRNCFLEFAQHSMFFRWICGKKVVFLFYFSATLGPPLRRELWILPPQQALFPFCFRPRLQMELDWMLMCLFVFKSSSCNHPCYHSSIVPLTFFLWIKCLPNLASTGARIEFLLKVFVFLELLFYTHKVTQFHFLTFKP